MIDKVGYFKQELDYIVTPRIKDFATKAVEDLPDYFFIIPASSTGKYHPAYSLGNGGVARHTRAAVRIAMELARMEDYNFTDEDLDLCIVAIILHDGFKSGAPQETYSRADHPVFAANEYIKNKRLNGYLSDEEFSTFYKLVARHMGQWNTDYKTKQPIMDKPETRMEKFVALCDYLASRKCLVMDFDVEVSREKAPSTK
jgi:hypothetical protein